MAVTLTHIALHVSDLDACIDFYSDYCGMKLAHDRIDRGKRIVWLAEPGRENEFIIVLIPGGPGRHQADNDFSHFGFALPSRAAVDAIAERARGDGIIAWETRDEAPPVGYYCGVRDPDGNFVEFSFDQPIGKANS
jgi:catechol 2,3-dioxygenase-like lactoylglutathione lyase family enzyme